MARAPEDLGHRPLFDHLSAIHHHHPVRDPRDHPKVMGDPDDRHAEFLAQLFHQIYDLRLNRHIQRRRRLIRNQHLRIAGQRDGDHHPLPHPAGKLMRKVAQPAFGIRNAHQFQQFLCPRLRRALVHPHMPDQRLAQLVAHGKHRVERGHRVLKDETDPGAAHRAQLLGGAGQQVHPAEHHPALAHIGRRRGQKPDQRHHGDRFARAAFAHHAQQFAGPERERDRIDRVNLTAAGPEYGLQALDIKDRLRQIAHMAAPRRAGARAVFRCFYCPPGSPDRHI